MPINVFGNSSSSYGNGNKNDTGLFVQEPKFPTNCVECNIEEDIDLKSQFKIKNLPDLISIREEASKNYVDNKLNDPSKIKNTNHVDFDDKNLNTIHFIRVNSIPTLEEQLTPKIYVDQAISDDVDNSSFLGLDPDEKLNLDEQDSIILNSALTSPTTMIEIPTKSYVDSLHESSRKRRDFSSVFNDQDIDFDNNKLNNLDSITVN